MKIRLESDDNLPFGKILSVPVMGLFFKKTTGIIHKFFCMNVCINLYQDYRKHV